MGILEHSINSVEVLLREEKLEIPEYQRPYKWTGKNVNQLIDDIRDHKDKTEYRLGTLVLHRDDNEKLNIVDGQQRMITLILIAHAINMQKGDQISNPLVYHTFLKGFSNDIITKDNIKKNFEEIKRRINDFDDTTIKFFLKNCTFVKVVLEDVSEAFQFFDSQNARGKDLEPHDLLKAFHLREMNADPSLTEKDIQDTVRYWEDLDTVKLSKLFAHYLYRIRNWSKGRSARYFTKNEIDLFKGISFKENYPFAKSFRRAHVCMDNYPFQIDQVIINGKLFFEMVTHYDKLIDKIKGCKDNDPMYPILSTIKTYPGNNRIGDKYVRNLFWCGLIYYVDRFMDVDRFEDSDISDAVKKLFIWAYSLRLKLSTVRLDSVDKYALGEHEHSKISLFKIIREAIRPNEFLNIKLDVLHKENVKKEITEIVDIFKEMRYYE